MRHTVFGYQRPWYVSIHASVKDATVNVRYDALNMPVSIHASVKDATYADDVPDSDKNVSIHASVKDATKVLLMQRLSPRRFNPRICKRCDDTVFGYQRPWYVSIHASVKDATYESRVINEAGHVSIHASVKDATNLQEEQYLAVEFQSTHL